MLNADLENFTIDQFAGALALSLGAVGSLLLVIWQSKCHCRINLCYLFTCERKPGPAEDDPKKKDKKDKKDVNTEYFKIKHWKFITSIRFLISLHLTYYI